MLKLYLRVVTVPLREAIFEDNKGELLWQKHYKNTNKTFLNKKNGMV